MKRKTFSIALICALISCIMLSMVGFKDSCDEMYDNIIRIRIIANSDSAEDQALKIKIRDAVLETSNELYDSVESYEDAVKVTEENTDILLQTAISTIKENGYDYKVSLELREEFFDTRVYDDFTLPAGNYKTAVFTVGEGKGENWWCIAYPPLCYTESMFGELSESGIRELSKVLSDESLSAIMKGKKVSFRFKIVDEIQKLICKK